VSNKQRKAARIAQIYGLVGAVMPIVLMLTIGTFDLFARLRSPLWIIVCPFLIFEAFDPGPADIYYFLRIGLMALLNGIIYGLIGAIISVNLINTDHPNK
jgi:hypothetical protein